MKQIHCKGCENNCIVTKYEFANGNVYYSGNKCEKIFSNRGSDCSFGENVSAFKYNLLFHREGVSNKGAIKIGIPRALNMYENYPFWHELLTKCNFQVVLSDASNLVDYEKGISSVMSDNICFPAKLVHGHIKSLESKGVDRILMPYVIFESKEDSNTQNSFNCPIVSGYSDVIRSSMNLNEPLDSPVISFKDLTLLKKACKNYINDLFTEYKFKKTHLSKVFEKAFLSALEAQNTYLRIISQKAFDVFHEAEKSERIVIMLAGRPYHHDPLIQHKISDMIASFGVDVITDDIVRFEENEKSTTSVMQWAYTNRMIKAARWVANKNAMVHYVQLSSFGCGPDAFVLSEISDILKAKGKNSTLLKIDDVSNIGSLRLRVRSLIESLRLGHLPTRKHKNEIVHTAVFEEKDKNRTIIMPHFSYYYSPMVPVLLKLSGYNSIVLPISDNESAEIGLKYVNNEVCYPATLIVGDVLKALSSGKYDLKETAVIITQTGGQCRATNYLSTIKKAMSAAGFSDVPVLSLAMGDAMINSQPGFKVDWAKHAKITVSALLFTDSISKLYYSSVVREKTKGVSAQLRDKYLKLVEFHVANRDSKAVVKLLEKAVVEFSANVLPGIITPKLGVVGEIFAKFNSFAHKDVVNWLVAQDIEIVIPPLTDFFMQYFVNARVNKKNFVEKSSTPSFVITMFQTLTNLYIKKFNRIGAQFEYFIPFSDISKEAKLAGEVVNLSAQFGEGWLIPAELSQFAINGVNNAISLQPFGCIPNHVVAKGIEKRITDLFPNMSVLFLDFDSGVSDVNLFNRLHFMVRNAKQQIKHKERI